MPFVQLINIDTEAHDGMDDGSTYYKLLQFKTRLTLYHLFGLIHKGDLCIIMNI